MIALAAALVIQERIDWKTDPAAAIAEARREGKLLVVHFFIEGRPACVSMEEETLRNAEVVRASRNRFVNAKIDVDKRTDFYQGTVGGRGGLATCILDGTGDVVSVLHGFVSAEEYLRFLEKASRNYSSLQSAREKAAAEDPAALAALGDAYLSLESRKRAEEGFEKVIAAAKAPDAARVLARERLARMSVLRGKNLEARAHLAEVRKLDPDGRLAHVDGLVLTEALALAMERKHIECARRLDEALTKFPKSGEADLMKYTLGFVLHQLPEDKRALAVLEGMVRDHPDSPWVKAAREQIDHIKNPQPDHTH